jgi:hypothetical protein
MFEYAVWGISPKSEKETILYTKAKSFSEAEKVCVILEKKHKCKELRIQVIDLQDNKIF